jgi:cytochrome P450
MAQSGHNGQDRDGRDRDRASVPGGRGLLPGSVGILRRAAGVPARVNLIASGTLALLTHPREMARLRADRSLHPAAVEELLRYTSPVNHANDRFTTEEVSLGGVAVPAGEWVIIALPSANRDPARFPGPDRLDLDRDISGHVAFGHGIHYCLGAPLARMEAEVALGTLLDRFSLGCRSRPRRRNSAGVPSA